jgi:serine/threonine protein kinase/tetratricopeptide (TPR) repeat protein
MLDKTLAHYEIQAKIGSGGMGDVYRARDTKLDRDVAIKVLPREFAEDPERRKRFEREAKAVAALKHPNIVTIYSVEQSGGVHFITMEFVEGQPLSKVIPTGGLAVEAMFEYAIAVSDAIASAHEQGITHRDLKPANIMLDRDGRAKVLDFGLAKLFDPTTAHERARTIVESDDTAVGQVLGTAAYMSPEQAEGKPVDHRTDIFSLGIVLYEMATGEKPFKGETRISTISSILKDTPPSISEVKQTLPRHLGRIVNRCLEKNADRRFQSAKDLRNDLAGLKREIDSGQYASGTSVSEMSSIAPSQPRSSRRWVPWAGIGVVAVIAAAAYLGTRGGSSAPDSSYTFTTTSTTSAVATPDEDRLMAVVFPFENLGAAEDAYFAAGVSDEITSRLTAVSDIGVISRTSATQYDRKGKTMKQVAEDLGVDYVLEGTVRWAKGGATDRVRITPQLIRASDDTQIWSETYDHEIEDIFAVQTTIANNVIEQLGVTLHASERELIENSPTQNVEAYKLYMQARNMTEGGDPIMYFNKKTELLQEATRIDPGFSAAFAELSIHHSSAYHGWDKTEARLLDARRALQKAKALAPEHYRTKLAQGYFHYYGYREYEQALAEFLAAAELVPNDADVRQAIGYIYRRQGKWDEAIAALEAALALNPQDPNVAANLAGTFHGMREFDNAIKYYDRAIAIEPDDVSHFWDKSLSVLAATGDVDAAAQVLREFDGPHTITYHLVWSFQYITERRPERGVEHARQIEASVPLIEAGKAFAIALAQSFATGPEAARADIDAAIDVLGRTLEEAPGTDFVRAWYSQMLALAGRHDEAVREARLAVDLTAKDAFSGPANLENLALIYAIVGREEEAIDILERLLDTVYSNGMTVEMLKVSPWWDPLRQHPRFQALLRRST